MTGLSQKAKNILNHKETKATLVRAEYQGSESYIEVTLPSGNKVDLFHSIVAHCAKGLSPNERKKVIADCEKQIDSIKDGNCPTIFREMLSELKHGEFEEDE
jgi:UTP:GlnB (protein PII) uridylyltransferase